MANVAEFRAKSNICGLQLFIPRAYASLCRVVVSLAVIYRQI